MEFENKIKSLPIWKNLENIEPLEGGITNLNFLVSDSGSKSVVRLGSDIPEHLVYRSNEIIVSEAAYQIGVSPKLIYNEPGVLVLEFIESKTLEPKTVRENLNKIVPIIRKIHDEHVFEKHTPPEWKDQLINLNNRINVLKYTIMFSAVSYTHLTLPTTSTV